MLREWKAREVRKIAKIDKKIKRQGNQKTRKQVMLDVLPRLKRLGFWDQQH